MSEFVAKIKAILDASEAEAKLKALQNSNETIKLKVELTTDGVDLSKALSKQINNLSTSVGKTGQSIGKQFTGGINRELKSAKFNDFYEDYFKEIKQNDEKAAKLVEKYSNKTYAPTQKQALQAVKSKKAAEQKAEAQALKQQKAEQKAYEKQIANQRKEEIAYQQQRTKYIEQGKKQQQENDDGLTLIEAYKQADEYEKRESEYLKQRNEYLSQGVKQQKEYEKQFKKFNDGEFSSDLKQMESKLNSFGNLDTKNFSNVTDILKEYQTEYNEIQNYFNGNSALSNASLMSLFNQLETSKSKFKNAIKEVQIDASIAKPFDTANTKFSELSAKLEKIKNYDLNNFENTNGAIKIADNINKATEAQTRLNKEMSKGSNANLDNINADLKIMQSELNKADTQWDNLNASVNVLDNIKAGNATLTWLKNNTKATKEYGESLTKLAELQKNAQTVGEQERYTKQVQTIMSEAAQKGLTGKSAFDETKRAVSQIAQFTGIYGVLQSVMQDLPKQMVSAVYEVDTAMTNLYKVTDETSSKYNEFMSNAGKSAKDLGRDMSSYITQTSEWAKLGFSLDQAVDLSKVSSVYANVGEVDDATAVSDIVTAMKANIHALLYRNMQLRKYLIAGNA